MFDIYNPPVGVCPNRSKDAEPTDFSVGIVCAMVQVRYLVDHWFMLWEIKEILLQGEDYSRRLILKEIYKITI